MAIDERWIYAQQSILGSVLISSELAGKLVFGVSADDFVSSYRSVYEAIRELYTTGKTVDPVAVLNKLGEDSAYRDMIRDLMEITPTAANIDTYINVCRARSRVHKYQQLGIALQEADSAAEAEEILSSVNLVASGNGMRCWSMAEAMKDFFDCYSKNVEYLHWFLPQLDPRLDLELGDFCLLGGRPSSGKSAFALEAAVYWAVVCGYRVGFYSHETNRKKLTKRIISACARVPLDGVKHSTLTDKQLKDVCDMSVRINEAPLDVISCAGKTVAEMQAFALAKRHQIIVVDYLQIVVGPGESEYAQVSAISKGLHVMCQSLGIFCLALCQLSRTRGARPSMEDLRSSGQLEQDADAIIFLHEEAGAVNSRELIIAKNKDGERGTTKLHFDGAIQHFSYLGKGDQPLKGYDYRKMPGYRSAREWGNDLLPGQFDIIETEGDVPFKD